MGIRNGGSRGREQEVESRRWGEGGRLGGWAGGRDQQDQIWIIKSETKSEKVWVSMTRPRLKMSESQRRDRDHKNFETKTKVVETIKDETSKIGSRLISENLSRPRLIETEKFYRCRDRDSSRPGNFIDVETETYRDWEILRLSIPRLIKTGQKMSRPRLYRESRWSLL